MGEAIVFTSGKGGVGKTTSLASIGTGLSQLDKKVIMLDADMGLRNLDVVMGLEDRITYNLADLLENKCRLRQALIRDKRYPNLYLIPASLKKLNIDDYEEQLRTLVAELKKEFDYVLIDSPAGIDRGFHFAICSADRAILVTTPHISSVRDAGRVKYLLEQNHFYNMDLLINSYNQKMVRRHEMLSVSDMEEIIRLKSIGCIPYDTQVIISQNNGIPVVSHRSKAGREYRRVAEKIPYIRPRAEDMNGDYTLNHCIYENAKEECVYDVL